MKKIGKYYQIMDKSKKYIKDKVMLEAELSAEFQLAHLSSIENLICEEFGFKPSKISQLKKGQEKRVRGRLVKAKHDISKKITESLDTANLMFENYKKFLPLGKLESELFPNFNPDDFENKTPPWTDQTKEQFREQIENDRELFLRNVFPPEKISELISNILTPKLDPDNNDQIYQLIIMNSLLDICLETLYANVDETYKNFVRENIVKIKKLSSDILMKKQVNKK